MYHVKTHCIVFIYHLYTGGISRNWRGKLGLEGCETVILKMGLLLLNELRIIGKQVMAALALKTYGLFSSLNFQDVRQLFDFGQHPAKLVDIGNIQRGKNISFVFFFLGGYANCTHIDFFISHDGGNVS